MSDTDFCKNFCKHYDKSNDSDSDITSDKIYYLTDYNNRLVEKNDSLRNLLFTYVLESVQKVIDVYEGRDTSGAQAEQIMKNIRATILKEKNK